MTPLTSTRPGTISTKVADSVTELAAQPLQFSSEGQCTNIPVKEAVMEALANKRSSDQLITCICKNAYLHSYQWELNELINQIETQHGSGTVAFNKNVLCMLADEQIMLTRTHTGSVRFVSEVLVQPDSERQTSVHSTLENIFPEVLCQIINSYDAELEISDSNEYEICAIVTYGDPGAKSMLFATANQQQKMNKLFDLIKACNDIDLSHVNLSNLDFTGCDFSFFDLSFSDLRHSCLKNTCMLETNLTNSNSNCADFSHATLKCTNFTDARLINANLYKADITRAKLKGACLIGANLEEIVMGHFPLFIHAVYSFATITVVTTEAENRNYDRSHYFPKNINASINAIVVPKLSDHNPAITSPKSSRYVDIAPNGTRTVVIDEQEKELILATGIRQLETGSGMLRLGRSWAVVHDPLRKKYIESSLNTLFSRELTDIVSAYDDEIEFAKLKNPV